MNIFISFFLRKDKIKGNGEVPIICRITAEGVRKHISTGISVEPSKWDTKKNRIKGSSTNIKVLNEKIRGMEAKLFEISNELLRVEGYIDLDEVKATYQGKGKGEKNMKDAYDLAMEYASSKDRAERIERGWRHFQQFLKWKFNRENIRLRELPKLGSDISLDYPVWGQKIKGWSKVHLESEFQILRQALGMAVKKKWINTKEHVTKEFKITDADKPGQVYLTMEEFERFKGIPNLMDNLIVYQDLFLFQCYTGLNYQEAQDLEWGDIMEENEFFWINRTRIKSKIDYNVPLVGGALEICEKYRDHLETQRINKVLPQRTNQKTNLYLKYLAEMAGIEKRLTSHVGRRTFGNLLLNSGVSRDMLKEMMAHKSDQMSRKYALVNDDSVLRAMMKIAN